MLEEKEIQTALHAERVVPLDTANPHGPFGLEQLAATVDHVTKNGDKQTGYIRRTIVLPVETWAKLDGIADELCKTKSQQISASEVATALVIQALNGSEKS